MDLSTSRVQIDARAPYCDSPIILLHDTLYSYCACTLCGVYLIYSFPMGSIVGLLDVGVL